MIVLSYTSLSCKSFLLIYKAHFLKPETPLQIHTYTTDGDILIPLEIQMNFYHY